MEPAQTVVVEPHPPGPTSRERRVIYAFFGAIRTRIISGLILALPIAITFWIVYQLYLTLMGLVIEPTLGVIEWLAGPERMQGLPTWWRLYVAPVVALGSVLAILYFFGLFVSTRLARFIDWTMSRVPVVTTIYHTVRGVFQSLGNHKGPGRFKRVVSVPYGGPGLRVPGFVTQSMRDPAAGKTILSVFVPFKPRCRRVGLRPCARRRRRTSSTSVGPSTRPCRGSSAAACRCRRPSGSRRRPVKGRAGVRARSRPDRRGVGRLPRRRRSSGGSAPCRRAGTRSGRSGASGSRSSRVRSIRS